LAVVTVKIAQSIAALITKVERRLAKYPNNRIIFVTPNNKTHEAIPTPRTNALTVIGKGSLLHRQQRTNAHTHATAHIGKRRNRRLAQAPTREQREAGRGCRDTSPLPAQWVS
jgi:hypothetical protein